MGNLTDNLKKYFKTHTKEEVLKDWEETAKYNKINSPLIPQRKTIIAISFCNSSDDDLLIKTLQTKETIETLIKEFKQTEIYNEGDYSDDDIIDFMREKYNDIEGVEIYPQHKIVFCKQ